LIGEFKMSGRKKLIMAVLLGAAWLSAAGCADGILLQKADEDGGVQRLRLDGLEGWSEYDTTPRYRSPKSKDYEGYGILMKNEATF